MSDGVWERKELGAWNPICVKLYLAFKTPQYNKEMCPNPGATEKNINSVSIAISNWT